MATSMPPARCRRVDFPQPEGPTTAMNSRGRRPGRSRPGPPFLARPDRPSKRPRKRERRPPPEHTGGVDWTYNARNGRKARRRRLSRNGPNSGRRCLRPRNACSSRSFRRRARSRPSATGSPSRRSTTSCSRRRSTFWFMRAGCPRLGGTHGRDHPPAVPRLLEVAIPLRGQARQHRRKSTRSTRRTSCATSIPPRPASTEHASPARGPRCPRIAATCSRAVSGETQKTADVADRLGYKPQTLKRMISRCLGRLRKTMGENS